MDQSLLSEISIHALREEGDERICVHSSESGNFYPRPPRGGRLLGLAAGVAGEGISIHALREEGDSVSVGKADTTKAISIHALREEGDRTVCGSELAF